MELEDENQTITDIKFLEWRLIQQQYQNLSRQEQYEIEKAELEEKNKKAPIKPAKHEATKLERPACSS